MDADVRFGQIALSHDLITKKQHTQAWKVLKDLRGKAKGKRGKKGKVPRLVDVLVKKKHLTGRQAKSLENARVYQQARLEDKLYARIVLKSKFSKPKRVEKGLQAQRESYLDGDDLIRLSEYLLDKNYLTEEQDEAIQDVLTELDVEKFMGGRSKKGSGSGSGSSAEVDLDVDESDDLGSDESVISLDSDDDVDDSDDLEEIEELDLDSLDSGSGSDENIDDAQSMADLDSEIDGALSGIDEDELELDSDSDETSDSSDDPPPHGLSSDDLGSDEDLDAGSDDDLDDDLSDDLGSAISLDSEDVAAASGRRPKAKAKAKAKAKDSDFDISDIDLDDD